MYSYKLTATHVVFRVEWPNKKGYRQTSIPRPTCMSEKSLHLISTETVSKCQRGTRFTGINQIETLKLTLKFAQEEQLDLPPSGHQEWRVFVYKHLIHHLSHPEKIKGSEDKEDETLRGQWRDILELYKFLKQKKIIPYNILLPLMRKLSSPEEPSHSNILDSTEDSFWPATDTDVLWPKVYLIDKDLNTPTDRFLENLQGQLEKRSNGIIQACHKYWKNVMHCHEAGAKIIESISIKKIEKVIKSGQYYINNKHLADPDSPNGVAWFLATIDYYFCRTDELKSISYKSMEAIPFFQHICGNFRTLLKMKEKLFEIAGEYRAPTSSASETLIRLLGHLSTRDCSAATAILIAENPKFTPSALQEADYLSTEDKPVHFYNSDLGRLMFSVSKPRAASRKTSPLPPLSHRIYQQLVRATLKPRKRLMADGDPIYRKLFLTSTPHWVGMSNNISNMLVNSNGVSLYSVLEPELIAAGVYKESFSLKRIRGTQGLIAFLKEGSLQSVANTLGNTISVVKNHYIPKWLMHKWNTRILRIFQTKLVVLATKNKPWHLESSDFLTKDDLFKFIINSAVEAETSDPISFTLKRYAAELTEDTSKYLLEPLQQHKLFFKLDASSFAAIFLFSEMHTNSISKSSLCLDPYTKISAESIVTLAHLLHGTYAISIEGNSSNPILTNIAGFSLPLFRKVYIEAIELKMSLSTKVIATSIIKA